MLQELVKLNSFLLSGYDPSKYQSIINIDIDKIDTCVYNNKRHMCLKPKRGI